MFVAGIVAGGVAACALFPDLSSLGEGSADASDVSAPDVSDAPDGASDAGFDAPSSPCNAPHLFCDDFDHGALGATWDDKIVQSGPLVLSPQAVTPPYSLEATATSSGSESSLGKFVPAADHTHIEFDVLVVAPTTVQNTELDIVDIVVDAPPPTYTHADFDLQRSQGASVLEEYLNGADGGTGQDIPVTDTFSTWRHVALDLDFPAQTLALAIDGQSVTAISLSPTVPKSSLSIYFGVGYVDGLNGDWNVLIDNVVIDQP